MKQVWQLSVSVLGEPSMITHSSNNNSTHMHTCLQGLKCDIAAIKFPCTTAFQQSASSKIKLWQLTVFQDENKILHVRTSCPSKDILSFFYSVTLWGAASCMFSLCLSWQRWTAIVRTIHPYLTCCCLERVSLCEDEEENGRPCK